MKWHWLHVLIFLQPRADVNIISLKLGDLTENAGQVVAGMLHNTQ